MSLIRTYVRLRRAVSWIDLLVLLTLGALAYALMTVGREWQGTLRPTVDISLSPWMLPMYTFFSLTRGFAAYGLSLVFTLAYGYVAAYVRRADRVMLPLLDILQSIPVLGFLPSLIIAFITLFPKSNVGLELAAVLMIFTGQVWNMTFSFYNSLKSIPYDLREAARVYKLNWWQRFTKLEMPYSAMGLVWNSMMSMAGGWFFLTINEAFVLGDKDFRLPGIGSYMSVAIQQGNIPAMVYAVLAMTTMIVLVDQVFWRPIVAWAQKYKFEETGAQESPRSFVLDLLQRSQVLRFTRNRVWQPISALLASKLGHRSIAAVGGEQTPPPRGLFRSIALWLLAGIFGGLVLVGIQKVFTLIAGVSVALWLAIILRLFYTLARVLAAITLGTMLMVPLGVKIGMTPRLSRVLQPVVQVVASFPAPMLFPLVILLLAKLGIDINIGAIALMLLGTQWYILFNVVAGAMAIPQDLLEAADVMRLSRWKKWRTLIIPGIIPSLITGWVTAAGGAWNASIVAEYVHFGNKQLIATGLGSTITTATDSANYGMLMASILAMTVTVVAFNRLFWKRLYSIAETRFSLDK